MKSNLTKVCLALLSAVFVLGCQDLGTGPVGPDGLVPQFNKPFDLNKVNAVRLGGSLMRTAATVMPVRSLPL